MNSTIAKLVAAVVAVVFIGSGLYQFFPSNVRPPMLGVALVVSGTAILFGRSWGYYIAYLAAFSSLMSPQRTWLVPIAQPVRRTLWLYAGMEPELINVLLSLLCAGMLGWTHYVLLQTRQLDQPLSLTTRRWTIIAALLISIARRTLSRRQLHLPTGHRPAGRRNAGILCSLPQLAARASWLDRRYCQPSGTKANAYFDDITPSLRYWPASYPRMRNAIQPG